MFEADVSSQSYIFLCSLLNGLILSVVYTLFKCIRVVFGNKKTATVICDIIYMLLFTVFTFIFSVGFTNGFVRYYTLLGELLAFLVYKFTLGLLFDRLFLKTFRLLNRILKFLQKNISLFIKKLLKANHNMLYNKVNKKANTTIR